MVWLLRYRSYLRANAKKQTPSQVNKMKLTTEDIEHAEKAIVRAVQHAEYAEEILSLKKLVPSIKRSKATDRVLVCKSRGARLLKADASQPMILPRDHLVSALLVKSYHKSLGILAENTQ